MYSSLLGYIIWIGHGIQVIRNSLVFIFDKICHHFSKYASLGSNLGKLA